MKRLMISIVALGFVAVAVPAPANPGPFLPDPDLHALKEEAASLALFHELDLSPQQRADIRAILEPFRADLDRARQRMLSWQNDTMKPHLRTVIAALREGKEPVELSPENVEAHRELQRSRADMEIQAEAVFKRIKNVLSPEQAARLDAFRPMDELGFQRPGFGMGRGFRQDAVALLDEIRNSRDEDFQRLIDRLTARMDREPPGGGPFAEERHEIRRDRIGRLVDLMREVRAMPENEYAERIEAIKQELDGLMPPTMAGKGPGPRGMRGAGPEGRRMGARGMGRGFRGGMEQQGVIFSEAFFKAL